MRTSLVFDYHFNQQCPYSAVFHKLVPTFNVKCFISARRRTALISVHDMSFKVLYNNSGGDLGVWRGFHIISAF